MSLYILLIGHTSPYSKNIHECAEICREHFGLRLIIKFVKLLLSSQTKFDIERLNELLADAHILKHGLVGRCACRVVHDIGALLNILAACIAQKTAQHWSNAKVEAKWMKGVPGTEQSLHAEARKLFKCRRVATSCIVSLSQNDEAAGMCNAYELAHDGGPVIFVKEADHPACVDNIERVVGKVQGLCSIHDLEREILKVLYLGAGTGI